MSTPFSGKILTIGTGQTPLVLSPFLVTGWDNDADTIPAITPHSFSQEGWDNDQLTNNSNVFAFELIKDEWQ